MFVGVIDQTLNTYVLMCTLMCTYSLGVYFYIKLYYITLLSNSREEVNYPHLCFWGPYISLKILLPNLQHSNTGSIGVSTEIVEHR